MNKLDEARPSFGVDDKLHPIPQNNSSELDDFLLNEQSPFGSITNPTPHNKFAISEHRPREPHTAELKPVNVFKYKEVTL
jgi:hypothetical protein